MPIWPTEEEPVLEAPRCDLRAALERDPAARNRLEVFFCYPGLWAVWSYRVNHLLWRAHLKLIARWLSQITRFLTGIEIHPAARIGPGLFIDHGMGVVIGETAELGTDVTLYQGVTLGGVSLQKGKRHPTVGDRAVVGAGAKVLGAITVGEGARVGANAVVVRSVPADAVVVGVPGEIVAPRPEHHAPDLEHGQLPDVLGDAIGALTKRVAELERRIDGAGRGRDRSRSGAKRD
jgi:serine O-acetyltransferase